jgi:hypothetical protein
MEKHLIWLVIDDIAILTMDVPGGTMNIKNNLVPEISEILLKSKAITAFRAWLLYRLVKADSFCCRGADITMLAAYKE